jgi:hypothetical protein
MVERNPISNTIIFTKAEQDLFNVAAEVSPDSAVATALAFEGVAKGLEESAIAIESAKRGGLQRSQAMRHRAGELGTLATQVFELCPDEHLQAIAQSER